MLTSDERERLLLMQAEIRGVARSARILRTQVAQLLDDTATSPSTAEEAHETDEHRDTRTD